MSPITVEIHEYDPAWPERFNDFGTDMRAAIGDRAVRIDHIGSTSVPGLAAKPIIDIQVSVADFEPFEPIRLALTGIGYRFFPENEDRRKRYFAIEADGRRLGNLHVRRSGEFSEQAALLLRDYLRDSAEARRIYVRAKRALAERPWPTVDHYAEAKTEVVWGLLLEADRWAWARGWAVGASDL